MKGQPWGLENEEEEAAYLGRDEAGNSEYGDI